MRRLCERPGCGAPAEVAYGIDHASLVVWVDNKTVFEREQAGRLCRRHAEALVVPRGWTVDDRREPVPKLFATKDHPAPGAADKPKRGAGRRGTGANGEEAGPAQVLPFEEVPEVFEAGEDPGNDSNDDMAIAEIDPDETRAVPWSPRLVPTEPDDDAAPVFGRLLGRAFGSAGRDGAVQRDQREG